MLFPFHRNNLLILILLINHLKINQFSKKSNLNFLKCLPRKIVQLGLGEIQPGLLSVPNVVIVAGYLINYDLINKAEYMT